MTMSFTTQKDIADLHAVKLLFKQEVAEQATTGTAFKWLLDKWVQDCDRFCEQGKFFYVKRHNSGLDLLFQKGEYAGHPMVPTF
jgi:hypothetical protein